MNIVFRRSNSIHTLIQIGEGENTAYYLTIQNEFAIANEVRAELLKQLDGHFQIGEYLIINHGTGRKGLRIVLVRFGIERNAVKVTE